MGFGGKRKVITGYSYNGSFAQAVCMGPVNELHKILHGDTEIWPLGEATLDSSSADGDGKTTITTSIGTIHFYWGTANQAPSAVLAEMELDFGAGAVTVDIPSWPNLCYIVAEDITFGQETAPPTLHLIVKRIPTGLTLTAHTVGDDAVIPEVIYEYLTNAVWGLGISTGLIDTASFEAAAETTIDEELVGSPTCDENTTAREFIGKLLAFIDGTLVFKNGKLFLELIRSESTVGLDTIAEADLVEEPEPLNKGWEDTWNLTQLTFIDRDTKFEQAVEPWRDEANASVRGEIVQREFNFPWCKSREVAKLLAKRLGSKGGLIPLAWTLTLKPAHRDIHPGDRFFLTYSKLGITSKLVRVASKTIGSPESPDVRLDVIEELVRDMSNDYIPPADDWGDVFSEDDLGLTTPRLAWVPPSLTEYATGIFPGAGYDAVVVAAHRPTSRTVWWRVYYYPGPFSGNPVIGSRHRFPAKGQIIRWHKVRRYGVDNRWVVRVQLDTTLDYQYVLDLLQIPEFYAVTLPRDFRSYGASTESTHRLTSMWGVCRDYFDQALGSNQVDIEIEGNQFEGEGWELESAASLGQHPCDIIYLGEVGVGSGIGAGDFMFAASASLRFDSLRPNTAGGSDYTRIVQAQTGTNNRENDLGSCVASTYDRDDYTMGDDGTLNYEWGPRARTSYELLDVQIGHDLHDEVGADYDLIDDLDLALRQEFDGSPTPNQTLLSADLDAVLGAMVIDRFDYHNLTP